MGKKKHPNSFKINILGSICIGFLLFVTNCYQPKTGCLDIHATNFNVAADKECTDCCSYPILQLQVNYFFGDKLLNFNESYTLNGIDSFQMNAAKMYLSDFQWITSANQNKKITDTIQLYGYNQNPFATNDFVLVNKRDGYTFNIGHFLEGGTFKQIRFVVGLNAVANRTNPTKMPTTHLLSPSKDTISMYLDSVQGYVFNKMVLQKVNSPQKNIILQSNQTTVPIILNLNPNIIVKDGFNWVVKLKIDYKKLLQGIDFNQSQTLMEQKMRANTPTIFTLE